MLPEDRLRRLFEEAVELPPREREAFLARSCSGDPGLRRRLEALLAADARAGRDELTAGLVSPVAAAAHDMASAMEELPLPETVGPYRILGRLGQGGMGLVLRARQEHPSREVAVKIIPGGSFVDDRRLRLFQREIDSLARLKHPCIASIHDAGRTGDGQHYFALELVDGVSLREHLDRERPSLRERLVLFRRICEAIHYAHQRGVIHRDIKPANILVNGDGNPKILDFGLAKITGSDLRATTVSAEVGRVQGTLGYMSPEQASGRADDIDVRSDVYSLGVVLFEMLSGELPFETEGISFTEAIRRVSEGRPRRLGSLDRRLRGDLETIAHKALEREPARRYASAAALAEDVERYLDDRPILARPPSIGYEVGKLVRRHKVPSALALLLAAVIVTASVAGLTLWRRAEKEAATATTVSGLLMGLFGSADPLGAQGPDLTVRELLDQYDATALDGLRGQPEVESRVREALALAYRQLGDYSGAQEQMDRREEVLLELEGPRGPDMLEHLRQSGWNLHEMSRYREAARTFETMLGRLDGSRPWQAEMRARAQLGLADTLIHLGDLAGARRHGLAALELLEEREDQELGLALVILSTLEEAEGRLDAAEEYARRAVTFEQRGGPTGYGTGLLALRQLAEVLLLRGRCEEAEGPLRNELDSMERLFQPNHPVLIQVRSLLGESLLCQGRFGEAQAVLAPIDTGDRGFAYLDEGERRETLRRLIRVYRELGLEERAAGYREQLPEIGGEPGAENRKGPASVPASGGDGLGAPGPGGS